jgi:hypothetical protein
MKYGSILKLLYLAEFPSCFRHKFKKGKFIGAIPRAVGKIDKDIQNADVFNLIATEVRIDYVQHALSAII